MPQIKAAVHLIIAAEALVACALGAMSRVRLSAMLAAAALLLLAAALCLIITETIFYNGG